MTRKIALQPEEERVMELVVKDLRNGDHAEVRAHSDGQAYALSIRVQELLTRKEIASVSFEPPYRVTMRNGADAEFRVVASAPVPM